MQLLKACGIMLLAAVVGASAADNVVSKDDFVKSLKASGKYDAIISAEKAAFKNDTAWEKAGGNGTFETALYDFMVDQNKNDPAQSPKNPHMKRALQVCPGGVCDTDGYFPCNTGCICTGHITATDFGTCKTYEDLCKEEHPRALATIIQYCISKLQGNGH